MNDITKYDVYIDEDDENLGVDVISLVRKPAIMTDFIWMSESNDIYKEVKLEDEKRIITGPALIPDIEIIRKDEDDEPYFIKYSAQQIEGIVQKFFKEKDQYSLNRDHKKPVSGIWIYESWIVGEGDKSKDLGFDLPKGTWMITLKVEDDELWEGIKSGKLRGFSIEGLFRFKRVRQRKYMRRGLNSANVERILFNDETSELAIQFKEGDVYVYPNQTKAIFDALVRGEGICRTEGENKWGSWFVGKTPSIGAAVYEKLVETEADFYVGTEADVQLTELESISDYPKGVRETAQKVLNWVEKNGWGSCGTPVGKQRANQLAKGEAISLQTVKRMYSFLSRHKGGGADKGSYGEGCGRLMYDAWGGDAALSWSKKKLNQVEQENLELMRSSRVERFLSKYNDNELNIMIDLLERLRRITKLSELKNLERDIKNKNINMVSAITKSGETIYTDAEAMAVGVEVYFLNGEEKVKIEAGEYELEDGTIVVIGEGSTISELIEAEVEAGYDKKDDDEDKKDKNEEVEQPMEPSYDASSEFEAIKGMLENISMKLDTLIETKMAAVEQSITELKEKTEGIEELEAKVEKLSVQDEMKAVETIDDVKRVVQSAENKKRHLDYNIITRVNKKF